MLMAYVSIIPAEGNLNVNGVFEKHFYHRNNNARKEVEVIQAVLTVMHSFQKIIQFNQELKVTQLSKSEMIFLHW